VLQIFCVGVQGGIQLVVALLPRAAAFVGGRSNFVKPFYVSSTDDSGYYSPKGEAVVYWKRFSVHFVRKNNVTAGGGIERNAGTISSVNAAIQTLDSKTIRMNQRV
jgi:hypothetical protein